MSEREKKRHSLAAKTVGRIILSSFLLGAVALLIGLLIYGSNLFRQSIDRACKTARLAVAAATNAADSIGLSKEIMGIYRGLTPEQRSLMESDAEADRETYRGFYTVLDSVTRKGGAYDVLRHMLRGYKNDVDFVYLAMYDEETSAMVYIADSDEVDPLAPGEWEKVDRDQMMRFLNWDGEGDLYTIGNTEKYGWLCTAGCPIRDQDGEICEYLLVDVSIGSVAAKLTQYALQIGVALLAATVLIAWLMARRMKKSVAEPIDAIAGAAVAYVQDRQSGADNSDHFSSLGIHTGDELENLSRIMAGMEKSLAEHEKEITRVTAEKERIDTEMHLAAKIQSSMLPHVFPPFPDRHEFDLYASMDPAKEVGGDFYDFFLIDDDHLCLVMADVSGKGVPAALFMMVSKVILQSCAMLGRSAGEILTKTNEALCSDNQVQMFVTVWLGILEISTGKMKCANAGHEYPAIKRAGGRYELYKDRHGFVIGGMAGMKYKEYEMTLSPGDRLFLYTDGVPEATSGERELFGTDRMLAALNETGDAPPQEVLRGVRRAVDGFVQDAEQFDDLTMLCLAYKGKTE
ncbi:MAG: serine/threonine-protein phosphatase [Clostridia bacterium]|nr:serine/threonine-protein phosphatase [Clostridia bacterium]